MRVIRDGDGGFGPGPRVVAIGVFDGLHRGHQGVLQHVRSVAAGRPTAVVTFDPHPAALLAPSRAPRQIGSLSQRLEGLATLGIDDVRVVSFTEELAHESAASFVSRILVDECAASCVVVGEDFRFGHSREGDVSFLRRAGRSHSFDVVALAPLGDENRWSSTAVRTCVAAGEMESAAAMLGRPFVLRATVVPGDQRGRELGYPTANMAVVPSRLIPADGVYAGATRLNGEWVPAAVSIGTRPQFYDNGDLLVEVHLPGFSGDLYGLELDTAFLRRLRGMAKFESLEELLARMAVDVAETEAEFRNFRPSAYELLT